MESKRYILGISGGGAGGEASAYGLCRILDTLPYLIDHVNAFAGTSVGAIIAAFLASGRTPQELHHVLTSHNKQVFTKNGWFARKFGAPVYDSSHLEEVLYSIFGGATMETLKYDCYLTAYRVTDEEGDERYRRVKIFSRDDSDVAIVDAIMASAAAPWYFGPWEINGTVYGDGGLVDNLPTLTAISLDRKKYGHPLNKYKALSIITGGRAKKPRKKFRFGSVFSLAKNLPSELIPADIDGEILKIDNLIGIGRHFVARPPLTEFDLDDVGIQPRLKKEWATYLETPWLRTQLKNWLML